MVTQAQHQQLVQRVEAIEGSQDARHDELMTQFAQTNAMIAGMATKEDVRAVKEDLRATNEQVRATKEDVRAMREQVRAMGEDINSLRKEMRDGFAEIRERLP